MIYSGRLKTKSEKIFSSQAQSHLLLYLSLQERTQEQPMNMKTALKNLMNENGFTLIRCGKHNIWKDKNGLQIVTSVSPSDHRTLKNIEATIKKARLKAVAKK